MLLKQRHFVFRLIKIRLIGENAPIVGIKKGRGVMVLKCLDLVVVDFGGGVGNTWADRGQVDAWRIKSSARMIKQKNPPKNTHKKTKAKKQEKR